MQDWVKNITGKVEPIEDSFFGPRYRCSLTLKDGTFLPCGVIQSRRSLVELAKRRIREEMDGKGRIGGDDPYGQIVTTFVARGNKVNDYDIASSDSSQNAIPLPLLRQIHGETFMPKARKRLAKTGKQHQRPNRHEGRPVSSLVERLRAAGAAGRPC